MAHGETVTISWQGRRAEAFVPAPLRGLKLELPERVVRATERAAAALRQADESVAHGFEPLARLLLRAEGVASSHIEGVRASPELVAVAELDADAVDDMSAWVADNLAVVDASLEHARSSSALTVAELNRWHARLMIHGTLTGELVGRFRRVQSWVGGATPRDAAYVPPPPEHVRPLMDDLVRFTNGSKLDPVTLSAVVHAQFEVIHPYGDGNGRLGRVLIGWVLARRGEVAVPPPVSLVMARDTGGYLAGLTRWRRGDRVGWVGWMAEAVNRSAAQVLELVAYAEDVRRGWNERLSDVRSDAAGRRLLDVVPRHLVLNAPLVADVLGVSAPTARAAIETLAARGILQPLNLRLGRPGRPSQWWTAPELVSVLARWSR